jgi:hypothetical protein
MAVPKELVKWPTTESEVTVDGMLRVIGAEMQFAWLRKQKAMDDGEPLSGDLYMARTESIISGIGLMAAIRSLRDADPAKAEAFVRDYWLMCDSGDSFGELLWEYTNDAGLDPALVSL